MPASVQKKKHISLVETSRMGIPEEKVRVWRETSDMPSTSDLEGPDSSEEQPAASTRGGRKRAGTRSVVTSNLPLAKRSK